MTRSTKTKSKAPVKFNWDNFTVEELRTLMSVIGNDGHTIYSASHLLMEGVDARIVYEFVVTHKSNLGDPKETISINDAPVDKMAGVYGLTVLWSLGRHMHVPCTSMGRGFQARELTEGIMKGLAPTGV